MFNDFDSYILFLFTPVLKTKIQNVKNSIDIELILHMHFKIIRNSK